MSEILQRLAQVVESRKLIQGGDPEKSYITRLFSKGEDAILKKIGEEATEVVMAAKEGAREKIIYETADLWFHCLIMLGHYDLTPDDVLQELVRLENMSGLEEKAGRKLIRREQIEKK